jgi:hypothetical protein
VTLILIRPSLMVVSDMTSSTKDKTLAHFFDTIHRNQQGNRDRFPERYRIIQRVDDCFTAAKKHLGDAQPIFIGPMFLRSQYAYKTAAGMTLAGQFSESFVLMRSCLEYAGYATLIFNDPRLEEVFLNRHADEASKNGSGEHLEISTKFPKRLRALTKNSARFSKICMIVVSILVDIRTHTR